MWLHFLCLISFPFPGSLENIIIITNLRDYCIESLLNTESADSGGEIVGEQTSISPNQMNKGLACLHACSRLSLRSHCISQLHSASVRSVSMYKCWSFFFLNNIIFYRITCKYIINKVGGVVVTIYAWGSINDFWVTLLLNTSTLSYIFVFPLILRIPLPFLDQAPHT